MSDRIDAAKDKLTGTAKEEFGNVTGNERTESEGKMERAKGEAKDLANDLKDKVSDAKDSVVDAVKKAKS